MCVTFTLQPSNNLKGLREIMPSRVEGELFCKTRNYKKVPRVQLEPTKTQTASTVSYTPQYFHFLKLVFAFLGIDHIQDIMFT